MFSRFRLLVVVCSAVMAVAAAISWPTSYFHPTTWFLDFAGSIKQQREFAEELRTRGRATSNNPWFGPIGVVAIQEGKLSLEYDGAQWIGSIPHHPQSPPPPTPQMTDISLGVFHFHRVGPVPPWSFGGWKCDLSLWFMFVVFSAYPTTVFVKGPVSRWRRRRSGLCKRCGYNLAGLTESRCPECGTTFASPVEEPNPKTT